ncbi:hypothetical protein LUZ61_020899 [Rhynchospora tenuis]|uniref:Calcium-transporting ATPase n=1 Tax=Rhynchospora tenuis TaxID=198213 RepID=A0AAD5ZDV1_9POAL|nr:hypothetical protein LUZ61_020899 [Rhynchospora tenuis]
MANYLRTKSGAIMKNFEVAGKNPSEEAQRRWREAVGAVVKNRRRRFRNIPDLDQRSTTQAKLTRVKTRRRETQERLRVAILTKAAALAFTDAAGGKPKYHLSDDVISAGFQISPEEISSVSRDHKIDSLTKHGGIPGISHKLGVNLQHGVKTSEIEIRQAIFGQNQYAEKPQRSFWQFLWDAFQDLTLIILIICAVVSVTVGFAKEGFPKGCYDGVGIIFTIFLVVTITAVSDYRQSLQFRDLDKEKKKISMQVTRDGCRQKVSIYELVVGDVVHLSIGDQVPADGLLISGYSLVIDESSLTGESEPVPISEKNPFLLGGTKVQDGSGKMLVTAVGMRTEWGHIMEALSNDEEDETPLQVKLNGVATIIGKIGLFFAIVTFIVLMGRFLADKAAHSSLTNWSFNDAITILNFFAISVTIVVVAVPEGLPLAVTLSLAFAMQRLMDEKALVRHLAACETMGSVTCICTDKTGTLTTNHMVVDKLWLCEINKSTQSTDVLKELKEVISDKVFDILHESIIENSGSEVVRNKNGTHTVMGTPTETALLEFALELEKSIQIKAKECKKLKVEPFNSDKKKMSTIISLPNGENHAFCKGASEIVLQMCDKIIDKEGNTIEMTEDQRKTISEVIDGFACDALRTLCVAYKDLGAENDSDIKGEEIEMPNDGYTFIALFGIKDPVRPGVKEAVKTCHDAGIMVRMVTGDNINTAKAIAKECGILTEGGLAIEGPEFRSKSSEEMKELIPKIQVMARSLPLDKHTLVTNLKKLHDEVVAVTGDGTNDAPALHEADIGLAMGIAGTEVAKENADVIIMDDNFTTIINLAKWGRSVYINIQKFVQFQLTVNVVALVVNFISASTTGSAPLTIVQLLWVNLIMDTLGALALATEPPNEDLMTRPPVSKSDDFITKVMWRNIIGQSMYQLIVLGILIFAGKHLLGMNGPDAENTLNTFIFNTFVFCQVFNEMNSREMEKMNIFKGIFNSWIFSSIILSTVIFQVILVEFLGDFANTVPLSWNLWLYSILIGSVSLITGAILKFIPVHSTKDVGSGHDGYEPIPSGPDSV